MRKIILSVCLDSDTHDNLRTKSRRKFVLVPKHLYFQYMELIRYWAFQLNKFWFKNKENIILGVILFRFLDSLAHRRTISALSLYYRYYHGVCSVELKSIIPPKAVFTRNTRFSNAQHPFAVKLNKNRTNAYANSFVPMTSRDWNSLPATVFPATYNLQLFKTRIHRHLQLLPSP